MGANLRRILQMLPLAAAIVPLAVLLYASDILSKNVSLYYDALWDFIPAVGILHGDSIQASQEIRVFHRPVPLISGPYQGAMNARLLAPLLGLLGTSPFKIPLVRMPPHE